MAQHAVDSQSSKEPQPVRGLHGALDGAVAMSRTRIAKEHRHVDDLTTIAAAEMDRLYSQIHGSGYVLRLTNAGGAMLHERLDPALQNMPIARICSSAPIHGMSAEVIAVLDAASVGSHDTRVSHLHMSALINLSAQVIEKCLFLRHHQRHAVLRFHSRAELVEMLHDGALALANDGTVIGADRTAVELLGAGDRHELLGRSITDIFDAEGSRELDALALLKCATLCPVREVRRGYRYYVSLHGARHSKAETATPTPRPRPTIVQVAATPRTHALTLDELAGEDPQMLRNVRSARRIADSGVSVLIQGPTGSGKEAFAQAMHLVSQRAAQPFIAVNCAAIPETLIESELFGYKPGAFTGARKEGMKGKILQSSGGTLFLDEIGDMPLALQTRLLRVLEEQEIVPLGSETTLSVNLHVIAASHHALRQMIVSGDFREDLYYRLNGITLELPALAQRGDRERVIHRVLGAETLDGRPAAIEMDALQRLVSYPWPGNIRELRNVIRTALAICEGGVVRQIDLPREIREFEAQLTVSAAATAALTGEAGPVNALQAAERVALLRMIEDCQGNMTRTAERLEMSRTTLYRKMKRHGMTAHGP